MRISLLILLFFTWTTLVQAFPFSESDSSFLTKHHLSTINNNDDITKTVEGLGSKETLKSITTAMLMAGLTGGGTPSTFMGHVSQQTANALYRIGIESAVYGRADGKGVALSAVAGAIGGKLSAEIGTLNSAGEIGFFTHKAMHALNGAGQALIVGGTDGMAAGALGATLAVTVAEVMMPTNGISKMDPKDRPPYSESDIQKAQAVSRVVAAMVALGAGMEASDVSIAIMAAITAVDHNCAKSALLHARAPDEQGTYHDLSPQEQEIFEALSNAAGQRYLDCLDAGMSHEQAQACVQADLDRMIEDSQNPKLQKASLGLVFGALKEGPALLKAARAARAHLKDILTLARAGINLDQFFKEKSNGETGKQTASDTSSARHSGGGGSGMPDPEQEPGEKKGEVKYPNNPDKKRTEFDPIKKKSAKLNKVDGSVWERDTSRHGGNQWKRWDSIKDWKDPNVKPNSIWPDGRVRK